MICTLGPENDEVRHYSSLPLIVPTITATYFSQIKTHKPAVYSNPNTLNTASTYPKTPNANPETTLISLAAYPL